jgi:hypothetical protein
MCELADVDYDSINFTDADWYTERAWTAAKQEEFRKWLYKHLLKPRVAQALYGNRLTTASVREQRTLWFITSYGWTHAVVYYKLWLEDRGGGIMFGLYDANVVLTGTTETKTDVYYCELCGDEKTRTTVVSSSDWQAHGVSNNIKSLAQSLIIVSDKWRTIEHCIEKHAFLMGDV